MAGWLTTAFIYFIVYPFGYVLIGVEWLGKAVTNWLAGLPGPKRSLSLEGLRDFANNANIKSGQPPDQLFSVVKWIVLVIVVALAAHFLWRLLRRYWKGKEEKGYEVIQESIWSWSSVQADLRSLLKGLGGRPRRSKSHPSPPVASTITEPRPLDIREVYRGLLWEGAASGHPKDQYQTPYEYGTTLEKAIGGQEELINAITDAYVRGRYGHVPASDEEALRLVGRWFSLRSAMRSIQP